MEEIFNVESSVVTMLKKFSRFIKRKKKPKETPISRDEFLKLKPVRNPALKWEKNEKGEVTIRIPIKSKGFAAKILPTVKERRIRLDQVGSFVWELCDGKRTVKDIVDLLNKRYKLLPYEAELSLNTYFNQLSKRRLLGFILPDEMAVRFAKTFGVKEEKD
ncbi:hypothetical protein DRO55_01495 [Candidatus Bathyarchaeota archaeon]|nr:MAG: hypothetical protein DRO55_01495 [Candidatus Bathyarchaeota archaeon]